MKHIAVIPARDESLSILRRNLLLFHHTASFVKKTMLYDEIIVTTNDRLIANIATEANCKVRIRPDNISGKYDSVKPIFVDLLENMDIPGDAYLWLFYIKNVFREHKDYEAVYRMVAEEKPSSVMLFIPTKTHPFDCWGWDKGTGKLYKFIEDQRVNHHEYPSAWCNHHYISCIRADSLNTVNNNLIGPDTTPIFFTETQARKFMDINEYDDIVEWQKKYPEHYANWWYSQPEGIRVGPRPT